MTEEDPSHHIVTHTALLLHLLLHQVVIAEGECVITITHRQRTGCSRDASPLPCVPQLGDRGHSVPGSNSSSPSKAHITWERMRRYLPQLRLWSKGECHQNACSLIFTSAQTSEHYGFSLNNALSMKERRTCNFSPSSQSWLWRKDWELCSLEHPLCCRTLALPVLAVFLPGSHVCRGVLARARNLKLCKCWRIWPPMLKLPMSIHISLLLQNPPHSE